MFPSTPLILWQFCYELSFSTTTMPYTWRFLEVTTLRNIRHAPRLIKRIQNIHPRIIGDSQMTVWKKIRLWSYFHWERKETQKRGKWHTGEYVVLCNTISSSNQTKGRTHACNNHCCICHLLASITSLYCPYGILGSFPDVHNVQLLYYTGHLLLARDHPPCFELNVVLR